MAESALMTDLRGIVRQERFRPKALLVSDFDAGHSLVRHLALTGMPVVNLQVCTPASLATEVVGAALANAGLTPAPQVVTVLLVEDLLGRAAAGSALAEYLGRAVCELTADLACRWSLGHTKGLGGGHMDFHYTRTTNKPVSEAMEALEAALVSRKFSALWHLDVQAKLREKGQDLGTPFHIFEVCNAARAKEALETNLQVGYFLPCKMVVYQRGGQTHIGLLRPNLLMDLLGEERLRSLASEVEQDLAAVVDEAAR